MSNQLNKIEATWPTRARVRSPKPFVTAAFEPEKLDFLPEWLPFGEHPDFTNLSDARKQTLLSVAWLLYNQSTISIEQELVIPFCLHATRTQPAFRDSYRWRQLLAQTVTDESYHVQLTEHASEITRQQRGLCDLKLPTSHVVSKLEQAKAEASEVWEKDILTLAVCIATEVFIGENLATVGKCQDPRLQPIAREATRLHMLDESVHASIFKHVLRQYQLQFTSKQQRYFNRIFPTVISWFFTGKLHAWSQLLVQCDIAKASEIIHDCKRETPTVGYDLTELVQITEEFGLVDLEDKVLAAI